jgi:hypothetical protein
MSTFKNEPKCEACGGNATVLSHSYRTRDGWRIICNECACDSYDISLEAFTGSASETIDWLAHVSGKTWFDPADFFAAIRRLRALMQG